MHFCCFAGATTCATMACQISTIGTLDSLMVCFMLRCSHHSLFIAETVLNSNTFILVLFQCGTDAPISSARMLGEVSRLQTLRLYELNQILQFVTYYCLRVEFCFCLFYVFLLSIFLKLFIIVCFLFSFLQAS